MNHQSTWQEQIQEFNAADRVREMIEKKRKALLSAVEISRMFAGETGNQYPPVLSVKLFAQLLSRKEKTVSGWIAQGRFEGALRKRGKENSILRDRALDLYFNGKDWT